MTKIFHYYFIFILFLQSTNVLGIQPSNDYKNILYINSYHIGYPWTDEVTEGLTSVFDTTKGINYYTEFMDTKRFMDNHTFTNFYETISKKYQTINFDIIIALDNYAVDFYLSFKDSSIFKNKPFVFAGITNIVDYNFKDINAYGVMENRGLNQLFYSMHRLFPQRDNVYFFMTSSKTDSIYRKIIKSFANEYNLGKYHNITNLSNDSIISFLKSLGDRDMAYLFNTNYDNTGAYKPYYNIFDHIHSPLNIPVFSNIHKGIEGITGGNEKKGINQGNMLAQIAIKLLNGEIIKTRRISPDIELTYNYRELKRFNVDLDLLPRDAVIVNRPETILSQFKQLFYVNLLFILASIAIIIILILSNTNLRKYRTKLEDARDNALQSESIKSSFIANISHEIRTPLNAIIGFSDILLIENKDEALRDYVKHIHKSSQILVRLVNDVLDLSLIDANEIKLNYSMVHLPSFMDELIQRNQVQLEQSEKTKLRLKLRIPENNPEELYTDQLRLNQVIQNLISNAIKYSEKGTITLSYQFLKKEDIQELTTASSLKLSHSQYCIISVKDYGIGIPQNLKNFVFERFRRLDQVYLGHHGGVGLGLNISKSIINIMGGEIWFTSEHGKGSVFSFILPHIPTET